MIQPAERLEEINSHQADDYWVLVRHEVCSSYLGLHVVPVPYLEDAQHYDLLNVLLEKTEKEGSRLLQRKSFFPMGPLREILASLDSKNAQLMEEQIKIKSHFTDDFDHEEMVLDEGVLKSIKLIVKDVNKEDSLFSIKPEILKVSHNFPWILSVRSIYVVYEVFYTTNMQLQVSDSKLIQQFKSANRIPIGFMCRKFRLESSGMIGDELDMSKSPCRANFVNSYSNTYNAMVRRYYTSTHELKTSVSTRSKGVSSLFRFMLSGTQLMGCQWERGNIVLVNGELFLPPMGLVPESRSVVQVSGSSGWIRSLSVGIGSTDSPGSFRVVPQTISADEHPRAAFTGVRMPSRTRGIRSLQFSSSFQSTFQLAMEPFNQADRLWMIHHRLNLVCTQKVWVVFETAQTRIVVLAMRTNFSTAFCRNKFLCMPFGIGSASEVFQCSMEQLFIGYPCAIIMDDIIVSGKDMEQYDANLKKVRECAGELNLKLNPQKCRQILLRLYC
ncbi:uncharacterized protein C11orf42 homolog [Amblyraja radiata]|uniref:uncharacterized protein C11orf42 homolog n=1 Tax=Amblyraja radiata TaxID=386614 RepID=UPI00140208F4|nr:uncharacterized protein C11orf42 homolog [Amblyraja radiata]